MTTTKENLDDRSSNPYTEYTTRAPVAQVLEGLRVASRDDEPACSSCGTQFYDGDSVTVHASQPHDSFKWGLDAVFCGACAPTRIEEHTFGHNQALASAYIGDTLRGDLQSSALTVAHPVIVDFSPNDNGY